MESGDDQIIADTPKMLPRSRKASIEIKVRFVSSYLTFTSWKRRIDQSGAIAWAAVVFALFWATQPLPCH